MPAPTPPLPPPDDSPSQVLVLAAQPPCTLCKAAAGMLCADGNRVHLVRWVRIKAHLTASPTIAGLLRVSWRRDATVLRWTADPRRPHLVFSEELPWPPTADSPGYAWERLEASYLAALIVDKLDPITDSRAACDPARYGTPGAVAPKMLTR